MVQKMFGAIRPETLGEIYSNILFHYIKLNNNTKNKIHCDMYVVCYNSTYKHSFTSEDNAVA